jgi:hypothetical protein
MEYRFGMSASFDRARIDGYVRVIAFDIGFGDATGHFDLWYRDQFSHEKTADRDYLSLARRITLWSSGGRFISASA